MTTSEHPWIDGLTFAEALARTAEHFGDRDALAFPQLAYRRSYCEFHADVRQVARSLLALGVQRGEHVGIWATNLPQWVLTQGERIKIHLHYCDALDLDKYTGIRFLRISPLFRRIAWPLSLAWARSNDTSDASRTRVCADGPTIA